VSRGKAGIDRKRGTHFIQSTRMAALLVKRARKFKPDQGPALGIAARSRLGAGRSTGASGRARGLKRSRIESLGCGSRLDAAAGRTAGEPGAS